MMRLQKFLAAAGVTSRRQAEQLILAGQIKVNGQTVDCLGVSIEENRDQVEYRGRRLALAQNKIYLALNKPIGFVSSVSSRQGPSVLKLINCQTRIYPVGRLDKNSEGLILLTNDGDWANRLTHPRYGQNKEYLVELNRAMTATDLKKLAACRQLDGQPIQPVKVVAGRGRQLTLILNEGLNREIRRLMRQLGYQVVRLQRIRIGRLKLGRLQPGEWKKIKPENV